MLLLKALPTNYLEKRNVTTVVCGLSDLGLIDAADIRW